MNENLISSESEALAAVKENPRALDKVPTEFLTERVCLEAIRIDSRALYPVPENLKTERFCLEAVKVNGEAIRYVPREVRTEQVCLEAVKRWGGAFDFVPEKLKTEAVCLAAVTLDGSNLWQVPEELKTEEVCMAAVKSWGRALRSVPKHLRTEELCLAAVKRGSDAFYYVPENLKTDELRAEAAKGARYFSLEYVPERLRTEELCLKAVASNIDEFVFVPEHLKEKARPEMQKLDYTDWLSRAGCGGINWENPPPKEMLTEEMVIADVADSSLRHIPEELRSFEVCFAAVYADDDDLRFVPEHLRERVWARKEAISEETWLNDLLWFNGNHLFKLPKKLVSAEFCRTMVERNADTIEIVPEEFRTPELEALAECRHDNDYPFPFLDAAPPTLAGPTAMLLSASAEGRDDGDDEEAGEPTEAKHEQE